MVNSLTKQLRHLLLLPTVVRVLAARVGATLARLRPIHERVYIVANRDGVLRGNLSEIERALRALPAAPTILRETGSDDERNGGVPILSHFIEVLRIIKRSFLVATSRVVIVDDYFFPIYPVKKRSGVTIIQVWHACGAFKRFGRATMESEWGADEAFLKWVPIHSNYDLTLVSSASIAQVYADAFGQPGQHSGGQGHGALAGALIGNGDGSYVAGGALAGADNGARGRLEQFTDSKPQRFAHRHQ
jgi:CDP-ribitol ribitolphosphotransferase